MLRRLYKPHALRYRFKKDSLGLGFGARLLYTSGSLSGSALSRLFPRRNVRQVAAGE